MNGTSPVLYGRPAGYFRNPAAPGPLAALLNRATEDVTLGDRI